MLIKSSMITFLLPQAVAMESAGFMNALTSAASAAPVVRKRKRVTAAKVFVYVVGVTFTLWWGLKKRFVYLFILVLFLLFFFLLLLLLLFADWNDYNYNSNIFSVKYQGRRKILCYCIIMLTFQWCCFCIHSWQMCCFRNHPYSLQKQFLVWTFQSSKNFLAGFILKNIICTSSLFNPTSFSRCK